MDLQLIPILSSFSTLLVVFQQRLRGWRAVSLSLLCLLAIGWVVPGCRPLLGVGSLLWMVFILVPLQMFAYVNHLIQREQFGAAVRWMRWARCLHPWDGWWDYPEMLEGLALAQAGRMGEARQIFQKYQVGRNAIERMATILLHRLDGRWQGLIDWVESRPENSAMRRDPNVQLVYLRALGETGQPEALIQYLQRIEQSLRQSGNPGFLHTARIYALAFAGQPDTVSWLLHQNLPPMSAEVRQYWIGTAYWMAGQLEPAQEILEQLRRESSSGMQGAIGDRLAHQPPDLHQQLSTASRQWIGRLQSWIIQESQYSMRPKTSWKDTPVTYALIAVNTAISIFFALNYMVIGLLIAYENKIAPHVLDLIANPVIQIAQAYRLGVLEPISVLHGSWWQLITAVFLHATPTHLIMNMLGLYVLGGLVEPMLGRWRFAIGYLVTGIGSMAVVTGLSLLGLIRENMVVGASGAIMGVLGMMGAVFLRRWRDRREAMAAQRLRSVVLIVVFQTMFDAVTPQVSMAGHLSGVVLGFLVGSLLVNTVKSV